MNVPFMSSKKKRKSPCAFASSKKSFDHFNVKRRYIKYVIIIKRRKLLNSFDKNRADVLAASDRGSHVEQEKLIVLDEEEKSRWENETISSSWSKIEDKGKDELARVIATVGRSNNFCRIRAKISLLFERAVEFRTCKGYFPPTATFEPVHVIDMRSIAKVT